MTISPKAKKILTYSGIGVLVILYAAFNVAVYYNSKGGYRKKEIAKIVAPTPTPSPTPTPYPIAQGKQIYNVNTSVKSGPRMSKVTIDPLDARKGQTQTIDVTVKSTSPITGVMVALRTDKNVLTNHKLALTTGTANDGVWSASWKMEVIHDYLYQVIVTATDTETSNSTTVTIR